MFRTAFSLLRVQVQSHVGELRSHKLLSVARGGGEGHGSKTSTVPDYKLCCKTDVMVRDLNCLAKLKLRLLLLLLFLL